MSIVVVGSANTDMVVTVPTIPAQGETVLGNSFNTYLGGKGANQAVAAVRAGGDVTFIASVGQDNFGAEAITRFTQEGINTTAIIRDAKTSGVALIMVNPEGKNCIAVSPEANGKLLPKHIDIQKDTIHESDVVLAQLETPITTITHLGKVANESKATFILNPAPAQPLPDALLACVDIITPNETEAHSLTGVTVNDERSAKQAANLLHDKGVKTVIITLGEQGSYLSCDEHQVMIPAHKVNAVDTTAAGDTYNGSLACAIVAGKPIEEAVRFATAASALSVMRNGALDSAPMLDDIKAFMREKG